jgi:hypothetical protein
MHSAQQTLVDPPHPDVAFTSRLFEASSVDLCNSLLLSWISAAVRSVCVSKHVKAALAVSHASLGHSESASGYSREGQYSQMNLIEVTTLAAKGRVHGLSLLLPLLDSLAGCDRSHGRHLLPDESGRCRASRHPNPIGACSPYTLWCTTHSISLPPALSHLPPDASLLWRGSGMPRRVSGNNHFVTEYSARRRAASLSFL